jgi:4-amino-4-deoxy-L-arabinose transferase-like glycosyltransferase
MAQVPVYLLSTAIFHDDYYVIRALRFTSVLFWISTVLFALQFLRILEIESEFLQIIVIGMASLLPTYIFLSSMINNDNMVILIGGLLLCSIARRKFAPNAAIITGTLLGFALLTKLSAVVYCPAIVALVALRPIREPLRWRQAFIYLVIVVTVSALIWLPWAARNLYVYGSITAETVGNSPTTWPTMAKAIISYVQYVSISFWSVSGITNNVYSFFPVAGIMLSGFALFGLLYISSSKEKRNAVFGSELDGIFLGAMTLAIVVNVLLLLRFHILYHQGQGRHLFPLLFPISVFIGIGLRPYRIRNLSVHIGSFFITYAVTFTLFSLASFPRFS